MLIFLANVYIIPGSVPGPLHIKTNSQRKSMRHIFVVQSLNHVQLFATPWTAAPQASLSFAISKSLFKLMSTDDVIQPSHLLSPPVSPLAFRLSQHQGHFQ